MRYILAIALAIACTAAQIEIDIYGFFVEAARLEPSPTILANTYAQVSGTWVVYQ